VRVQIRTWWTKNARNVMTVTVYPPPQLTQSLSCAQSAELTLILAKSEVSSARVSVTVTRRLENRGME
jgi:hypothetical protein